MITGDAMQNFTLSRHWLTGAAAGLPVGPANTMRRPAMTQLNIDDARCRALFASSLQQSDAPTAETVAEAIRATVRQFGIRGCAGLMAQEFGDHPEAAAERMRWVRQLLTGAPAPSQTNSLRSRRRGVTQGGGVTRAISGGGGDASGIARPQEPRLRAQAAVVTH